MSNKIITIIVLMAIVAAIVYVVMQFPQTAKQLPIDKRDLIAQKPIVKDDAAGNKDTANVKNLTSLEKDFARIASSFDKDTPFTIKRVWIEGEKIFVEYETGKGEVHQLLVVGSEKSYQAQALFVGSEGGGWSLVKGEGNYADPSALLYEKNANGQWTKRN